MSKYYFKRDDKGREWFKVRFYDHYYLFQKKEAKHLFYDIPMSLLSFKERDREKLKINYCETNGMMRENMFVWIKQKKREGKIKTIRDLSQYEDMELWTLTDKSYSKFNTLFPTINSNHIAILVLWCMICGGFIAPLIIIPIGVVILLAQALIFGKDLEKEYTM
ncbi:MAG: hypothetical protein HUK06_05145 [Bacteroidaceae bacterium]|nr:hypothetical protein [Bacteroidaceae bacterium]